MGGLYIGAATKAFDPQLAVTEFPNWRGCGKNWRQVCDAALAAGFDMERTV